MPISDRDKKYMKITKRLAISNNKNITRGKLAACLVIQNDLISIGQNSGKTHPIQKKFSKNAHSIFMHAEINCIINALRVVDEDDLQRATLYVHRVKRKSKTDHNWYDGLAEPCIGCKQAIEYYRIKKVVYSTNDDGVYKCL